MTSAHSDITPRELHVAKKMARRFVAEGAIFARRDFSFATDEIGKARRPRLQFEERLFVSRQMFGLIVAVFLALPEFDVMPELVGNFDSAIAALPDQRCVSIALVFEWFLVRIEVMLVRVLQ